MEARGANWFSIARQRFEDLLGEAERNVRSEGEAREREAAARAQKRFSESLNQGLRRLRTAATMDDVAALTVELASAFCEKLVIFVFDGDAAEALAARNFGQLPLRFSPNQAAAVRAAVESRDPVIALATSAEVSSEVAERLSGDTPQSVHLFPITVRDQVTALLLAVEASDASALELISNFGGIRLEALIAAPKPVRADLVAIAGTATENGSKPSKGVNGSYRNPSWSELSPEMQALHLRAQRFARRKVAEMRLGNEEKLRRGAARNSIYEALRPAIDEAREEFRREYLSKSPTVVDYLYLEMVRGLAGDEEARLGEFFPGPLI